MPKSSSTIFRSNGSQQSVGYQYLLPALGGIATQVTSRQALRRKTDRCQQVGSVRRSRKLQTCLDRGSKIAKIPPRFFADEVQRPAAICQQFTSRARHGGQAPDVAIVSRSRAVEPARTFRRSRASRRR